MHAGGSLRNRLEDPGVSGRIILEWYGGAWTDLDQDRDRWRAFVNAVMNLWVL
jgi:hypothetical protein